MRDDGDTWLGVPDDDAVEADAGQEDSVPVGGYLDGGGWVSLVGGEEAGPAHRVVHLSLSLDCRVQA